MVQKRSQFDSSEVLHRTEELLSAASNRYRITVQVAKRAKRRRYEDFENIDDPMMKPVIRAIMEMSDELTEPEIIGEFIEPSPALEFPKPKREQIKEPPFTVPQSPTLPIEVSEQVIQINAQVNANPQLQQLKHESNFDAWNCLINWITESACRINFAASEISVKRLQERLQDKSPREIARVLIVHKSLQAAGFDSIRGIPGAKVIIKRLAKYDLPQIAKLSAEMVYQIADIYGFNLQAPERTTEALTAFGAAFLGEKAIDAGIEWLKYGIVPSTILSAGAKALMIYAVGNAACLFYEAKLYQQANPLTSPTIFREIREESQDYLDDVTSEEAIIELISDEIDTTSSTDRMYQTW